MRQVWQPLDSTDVPQFYHRDIIGHHRLQEINYDDIVDRLDWDKQTFSNPVYDIRDIIATEDKFAIRFLYTATVIATGEETKSEAYYFYHLKDGKTLSFGCWRLQILITNKSLSEVLQRTRALHHSGSSTCIMRSKGIGESMPKLFWNACLSEFKRL